MTTILVESFSSIKINDISSGDAFSVYSNYPELAAELLAALVAYDEGRQNEPQINLSAIADALTAGTFDEWLTASWTNSPTVLRHAISLMSGLDSGDLEKVRSSFHKIADVAPPSQAQLEEWQGILDELQVPKSMLAFIPS